MKRGFTRMIILLLCSAIYWWFACRITGAKEPWDADAYWRLWYPASLVLSAMAGPVFKRRGWMAGAILTFAQFPVMWVNNGTSPLLAVALMMLYVLAVPAVAVSALSGWLAVRHRSV